MLREAKDDLPDGIYICFRTDGSLFNLRRLLARTKTIEELSCCLLTTAPFSPTRRKPYSTSSTASLMQPRTSASPSSLKKTEVLYQPPPRVAYNPPHISIDSTNLNALEHFTYLGSVISNDATVSKDLDNRLSGATSSFGRLPKRVWQSHLLRFSTKLRVYRAVVVPNLLYGAETWVLYRKQIRLLERFGLRCLHSIFGIKRQDRL